MMGTLSQDAGFIAVARTPGTRMALGSLEKSTTHTK